MATNKQILNAIHYVNRGMHGDNNHYQSIHRSITKINGENQVIKSDIREISTYVRHGNVNNK
jgi:hypothetical protein